MPAAHSAISTPATKTASAATACVSLIKLSRVRCIRWSSARSFAVAALYRG